MEQYDARDEVATIFGHQGFNLFESLMESVNEFYGICKIKLSFEVFVNAHLKFSIIKYCNTEMWSFYKRFR